jgi:hypothetical protein
MQHVEAGKARADDHRIEVLSGHEASLCSRGACCRDALGAMGYPGGDVPK